MYVVGITGGIGSGKSTVANLFAAQHIPIIDADLIARELVQPNQPALHQIVETFGHDILNADGSLDRQQLRDQIFSDPAQRQTLEGILHPLIRDTMLQRVENLTSPYAIMVIPLLVDTGNWDMIDRILVVDVEESIQVQRVMQRDHTSRQQAEAIIDSQISRLDRLDAADDVINNSGDKAKLAQQVKNLHESYLRNANHELPFEHGSTATSTKQSQPSSSTHISELIYEQPLNERIRIFLRLESIFKRAHYHLNNNTAFDGHAVICALCEIINLLSRGDIKSEIIKELERQHSSLKRHLNIEGVDQSKLEKLLNELDAMLSEIHANQEQLGQHLKTDLLFNNVRQRLSIPGGTCDFDLPAYSYWLNLPTEERALTTHAWLKPFDIINKAIMTCLKTIRTSTDPAHHVAEKGYYEQALNTTSDIQLLRVLVDANQAVYPTISGGKHRFNIRFLELIPNEPRSPQTQLDIKFLLMVCSI